MSINLNIHQKAQKILSDQKRKKQREADFYQYKNDCNKARICWKCGKPIQFIEKTGWFRFNDGEYVCPDCGVVDTYIFVEPPGW
jgi:hypothetical protein